MTTIKNQKDTLQAALREVEEHGALSKASANQLLTIAGPTDAVRMYVQHALDTRGELTPRDMMSMAVLTQPISVPTNPALQSILNKIREAGVVDPADADALFDTIGKLSTEEHDQITHLLTALNGTPGVTDEIMQDLIDRREPFLERRQAETAGFHKSIQQKTLAGFVAAMAAFIGILNIPGASELAQQVAMDHEVVANLLHMGVGLAGALGAGVGTRRVLDPGGDLASIETYGVHDLDEITTAIADKHGTDLKDSQAMVKDGVLALLKDADVKVPRRKDLATLERHMLKNWDALAAHIIKTADQTPADPAQAAVIDAIRSRWA